MSLSEAEMRRRINESNLQTFRSFMRMGQESSVLTFPLSGPVLPELDYEFIAGLMPFVRSEPQPLFMAQENLQTDAFPYLRLIYITPLPEDDRN